jgi:uncharacterized protein YchJ
MMVPAKGFVRNPLWQAFERNDKCPCGSGLKWKKCCEPLTHIYIKEEHLQAYESAMEKAKRGEIPAW